MITTISDETFSLALDKALKRQNMIKEERVRLIGLELLANAGDRDAIIDTYERAATKYEESKKQDVPLEKTEQIEFVKWFKETYPGVVIMMIRNDGYRTFAERPEQLLMGLHPGASDLYIPAWHCWVEMKRIKGSTWSNEQKSFCEYVTKVCADTYLLCAGFEDAKNKILQFVNK